MATKPSGFLSQPGSGSQQNIGAFAAKNPRGDLSAALQPDQAQLLQREGMLTQRQDQLAERIATRQAAGKKTGEAERKLERTQGKLQRVRGRM